MTWLTPEQEEAVNTRARRVVVRAAPGSGKTLVLTRRIAELLRRGVPRDAILALTFTRRAAIDLAARVPVTACTFHAFCVSLIDQPGFTIRDEDEVAQLARSVRDELGKRATDAEIRGRVRARLRELNAMSYDDVEELGLALAPKAGITHVLIDEAQDTSERQQKLVAALGAIEFWAGDWAQSIYEWRQAYPAGFVALCANAVVYDLTLNHRSGSTIAAAASRLAARMDPAGLVQRTVAARGDGSAEIADYVDADVFPPGDCAILCRTWDDCRYQHERLIDAGIPSIMVGGAGPWGTEPARRLVAALRLRRNPNDHLSLMTLGRGYGLSPVDVARAVRIAAKAGVSVVAAVAGGPVGLWMGLGLAALVEALRVPPKLVEGLDEDGVLAAHADSYSAGLPPQGDAVLVTTVHAAKGAEWPNVWVVGFDREVSARKIEEERRLLYVALTRGRDRVRLVVRDEWNAGQLIREAVGGGGLAGGGHAGQPQPAGAR